jgi:hypothetical protein
MIVDYCPMHSIKLNALLTALPAFHESGMDMVSGTICH